MKIFVLGGDGFCGWPTSLKLAAEGHKVYVIDNLSRRSIDEELNSNSLTNIAPPVNREQTARKLVGDINLIILDIVNEYDSFAELVLYEKPDCIVHFAEQRAAPYSMISERERRYTIDNNVSGTHNVLSAIVDSGHDIHFVHLGTMGVYGYSKQFGAVPEGYLNIKVNETQEDVDILYPTRPGSIYHLTKSIDQLLFQFYNQNWGIRITDLHQGIVWGVQTPETRLHEDLVNRFDYDGIYGTVLNRFIVQAAIGHPLTVYGTGQQTRAFIHIQDTANCVKCAIESPPENDKVRIFNQVAETQTLIDLATIIEQQYGAEIKFYDNPRKEAAKNELEVHNEGLQSIGFNPILLNKALINDVEHIAEQLKDSVKLENILNSPKW